MNHIKNIIWRRAWVVRRDGSAPQPITPAGCDVIDRGFLDAAGGWLLYYASPDDATERHLFRAGSTPHAASSRGRPTAGSPAGGGREPGRAGERPDRAGHRAPPPPLTA